MTLLRATLSTPTVRIAAAIIVIVALLALFGEQIAPQSAIAQNGANLFAAPSSAHLLGGDYLGRDVASRLVIGTRLTFEGALGSMLIGLLLGALPGMASAFAGRRTQFVTMRVVDAMMAFPPVIFAIAAAGAFGAGQTTATLAIGIILAPRFFRIIRAETLGLVGSQYVEAAELFGASRWRILRTHVVAKVVPTIAVTSATIMADALLAVSALAFLGLGPAAPAPTWGGMLADDVTYLSQDSWGPIWPGIAIIVTVASLNLIADGVRDASSGRVRGRNRLRGRRPRLLIPAAAETEGAGHAL
jgi:peptide/nickel transport system permease protein